jgi:N-methylhydantoinase A
VAAVHFAGGTRPTPILARDALGAGTAFAGPAILTQLDATTLVPPGWTVRVDASGALLLTRGV